MQDRLQDLREVGDNLVAAYHLFARQECTFSPRPLHPPPGGRAIEPYKLARGLRSSTENGHTHFNLQVLAETKNSPPNWNAPALTKGDYFRGSSVGASNRSSSATGMRSIVLSSPPPPNTT